MQQIVCTAERHAVGGPGTFLLERAETAPDRLIADYGGKVTLIYLDPPFGTGDTFHLRMHAAGKSIRLPAFTDALSEEDYLALMRTVLTGCHRLLSKEGSLYLHIDHRMNAKLRLMLDEIFGAGNFLNEIVWCYKTGGRSTRYYPRKHDTILFYRKSRSVYFDITAVGKPRGPEKRNHMKRFIDEAGRVGFSIRSGGKTYTYYEDTPVYPSDVWDDIAHLQQKDSERVGYGTQKPEALLRRILLASSRPNDLVMDLFSGSGTTAAAAAKLGRRYVAVDASPYAMYVFRARMLKQAQNLSFLDDAHRMTLTYPPCTAPVTLRFSRTGSGAREAVVVDTAYFEKNCPLVYAAIGTVEGETFLPNTANCRPKLPLKLPLNGINDPVLQLADAFGRQAFCRLSD